MATIEQSLKLHDNFSKVLSKIDQATQNTLGTFEKLDNVMNKEVRMAGTDQIEKSLASIDEQSGKVIQGIEKMQQTMDKMLENSNQKPLIEAEPTVRELNTMEQATERTSGIFDRIRSGLDNLRGSAVTEPLVKPDATVDALETIQKHSKNTQKTLGEIHFDLEDSVGRAEQRFELLREQMRLQGREVRMLKGHLDSLNESDAGQEAILKQERALNRANQAYLRNIEAVNKSRSELSQLKTELDHVSAAMSQTGQGGMNGFINAVQRSITWTQTLIDKVKQVALVTPKEAVMSSFNNGVDRARGKLSQMFRESRLGQSQFGQAIQKTGGIAGQFFNGLRTGFSDLGRLTRNVMTTTARLPFAWMKLIPIIGRAVQQKREARRATEDNINATNRLGKAVQLVKFGVWVMAIRKAYQMLDGMASKMDEMTNVQTRLDVMLDISGDETSLQALNDQIMASSLDARSHWQDTANFVARIGKTTDIFGNSTEIVAFSNLLQKSMRASGADADKMRSSMEQIALAMQRGKVEGRELRTLMDGAPLVVKSIADHFGMTSDELVNMAGEGVITAEAIRNAMFAAADEIEERFAEVPMTWADHWMGVRNVAEEAIKPLREAFNEFMNSEVAYQLFDSLTRGFVFVAQVAQYAFSLIEIALTWVADNIDRVTLGLAVLGSIALTAAIIMGGAFLWTHKVFFLIIGVIFLVVNWLHNLGITADQVVGFMAGAIMWLGTVIYNVIRVAINAFVILFQFIYNQFVTFYNNALAVAEFFMNVWNNPVYSTQKLFHNMVRSILGFFASMVDGAGSAGQALGKAFISGVNMAVRAVNWLIKLINKIPGINISTMGEFAQGGGGRGGAGQAIRNMADRFDPGDAPDNYRSLDHMRLDLKTVDTAGIFEGLQSPVENARKGYEWGSNLVSGVGDFMDNFGSTMGQNTDMLGSLTNKMGEAAKGLTPAGAGGAGRKGAADKLGKGKEVGDVGKIKSDVTISEEDLKYLRDIAETNYIIRLQQISPHATVNYSSSGGDSEQDAKKLLDMMEDMIVEQVATNLL